jgi:hypothetical protein
MKNSVCLLILANIFLLACKDSSPDNNVGDMVSLGTVIWIKSETGANLLNPSATGHIDTSKIKLFYLINGEKKDVNFSSSTAPKGFQIKKFEPNGEYYMWLSLNPNAPSVTYIQWSENDMDTVSCNLITSDGVLVANEVYWNGSEKFKNNDPNRVPNWGTQEFGRFFEVIK